ncbi:MAG: hypothetical protein RL033_320, partial [Pseudomonadota bacterium]
MVNRVTFRQTTALAWLGCVIGLGSPAAAAPEAAPLEAAKPEAIVAPGPAASPQPGLWHTPVSTVTSGQPLELRADFSHPELLRQAVLLYRSGAGSYRELPFRRSAKGYQAIVAASEIDTSGLAYVIELQLPSGERVPGFASRQAPFAVQVQLDRDDADEKAAALRVSGRRSLTKVSGEWVSFG